MFTARLALLLAATGLATAATAAQRPAQHISWGKAGVSFEDFTADGWACAGEAVTLDISKTAPVRKLVEASRALDQAALTDWMYLASPGMSNAAASFGIDSARVMQTYRPEREFAAVRDIQQHTMIACLVKRGYTPFALTAEQVGHLRTLKKGSVERRTYLFTLGSDPAVLSHQTA